VTITGPRQSGKTTLARTIFPEHNYVSFEQPLVREQFQSDPLAFLQDHAKGAIFDEVQHVPDLMSYLQHEIDNTPSLGRFILTGSQHFALSEQISQSLAGRTAILELLPFSMEELKRGNYLADDLDSVMWQGAYPPVHDRNLQPQRWYANYMATYIDRDVRHLSAVHDLDTFHRFMRLVAGSTGQLFNSSRLAGDCGVNHKTIRHWLNILQASYVAKLVPPYYRNFRKRIVKTPKLYFYDTGLACHLLGINRVEQLDVHPLRGALFENWVLMEIIKHFTNNGLPAQIYFWRTHGGQEVDFIVEHGEQITGIEVKAGKTAHPSASRSLLSAIELWPEEHRRAFVLFGGDRGFTNKGCRFLPWRQISELWENQE
jgi:predicted AAA+ superfamily ATPase